jgi:uncharacterized protein
VKTIIRNRSYEVRFLIVNVSDILQEAGSVLSIQNSLNLGNITWQGEPLRFKEPLSITGTLTNSGGALILNADIRGKIILQCGSCLESFEKNLDFTVKARLVGPSNNTEPDDFVFEGVEVDISDMVWEFLLLEIPIRRRCKDPCKGLCPECGVNLNRETCQCAGSEESDQSLALDQRMQVLKDYFSAESKEV